MGVRLSTSASCLANKTAARTVARGSRARAAGNAVDITHVPAIQTPAPAAETVLPSTIAGWNLGVRVTADEARTHNGGHLLQPSLRDLGPPQAVYVLDDQRSHLTTLVYTPPPGLMQGVSGPVLFAQLTGSLEPSIVGKGLGPESRLTAVAVARTSSSSAILAASTVRIRSAWPPTRSSGSAATPCCAWKVSPRLSRRCGLLLQCAPDDPVLTIWQSASHC